MDNGILAFAFGPIQRLVRGANEMFKIIRMMRTIGSTDRGG